MADALLDDRCASVVTGVDAEQAHSTTARRLLNNPVVPG